MTSLSLYIHISYQLGCDGTAVACGRNLEGQCNIPPLFGDLTYIQAAAGRHHTVLLRSDGTDMFETFSALAMYVGIHAEHETVRDV